MKINKELIAGYLGNALSDHLSDTGIYVDLIDRLKIGPKAKEWASQNLRWTLIDEETGRDLLECNQDKIRREGRDGLEQLARQFADPEREWTNSFLHDYAENLRYELHKIKTGARPEDKI